MMQHSEKSEGKNHTISLGLGVFEPSFERKTVTGLKGNHLGFSRCLSNVSINVLRFWSVFTVSTAFMIFIYRRKVRAVHIFSGKTYSLP